MHRLFIQFFVLLSLPTALFGQNNSYFESSETQTQILELYTSEGCSSCPPADRWLSSLKREAGLWTEFIPLAFHVDYWNYLGWKDGFSDERFSQRQRQYAAQQSLKTVYTPGFILSGREWRAWFSNPGLKIPSSQAQERVGVLSVGVDGRHLQIDFKPLISLPDELVLNLVVLGFDLKTPVKSGENDGRTLNHDFVVLEHRTQAIQNTKAGYMTKLEAPKRLFDEDNQALVVWLSRPDDLTPVQATGGLL